ncbi:hypothetical protein EYF80_040038 [Liparis tanakae]|uniref:Uncharacterized protein n=1 Tax=Liparis tanakae TaxID=230148 RepID=A0A4Z2G867_9TELE|nr:hypothetical protein EYF80_040038 [Liparis tanakae]
MKNETLLHEKETLLGKRRKRRRWRRWWCVKEKKKRSHIIVTHPHLSAASGKLGAPLTRRVPGGDTGTRDSPVHREDNTHSSNMTEVPLPTGPSLQARDPVQTLRTLHHAACRGRCLPSSRCVLLATWIH